MPDQAPPADSPKGPEGSRSELHASEKSGSENRASENPEAPQDAQPATTSLRLVRCAKLGRDLPGLAAAPFPTELGRRILASISQEAWKLWVQHSQMLINERGLRLSDPQARQTLQQECETFLFGPGAAPPPGWVPPAGFVQLKKKR